MACPRCLQSAWTIIYFLSDPFVLFAPGYITAHHICSAAFGHRGCANGLEACSGNAPSVHGVLSAHYAIYLDYFDWRTLWLMQLGTKQLQNFSKRCIRAATAKNINISLWIYNWKMLWCVMRDPLSTFTSWCFYSLRIFPSFLILFACLMWSSAKYKCIIFIPQQWSHNISRTRNIFTNSR